jgi:hypothetical protein
MAALVPVGTNQPIAVTFNSGKLTVNSSELGDVTNISLTIQQNAVKTTPLNKRVASYIRAGNADHSGSFDIEAGMYPAIISAFYGDSAVVTDGLSYSTPDTQPATPTVTITTYENDDTTKPMQYQFVNPILTNISPTQAQEAFGTQTIEVQCTEIVTFVADLVTQ